MSLLFALESVGSYVNGRIGAGGPRHRRWARAVRAGVQAVGLKLVAADEWASPTVTAAMFPMARRSQGGGSPVRLLLGRRKKSADHPHESWALADELELGALAILELGLK